jgi:hypothetical protein
MSFPRRSTRPLVEAVGCDRRGDRLIPQGGGLDLTTQLEALSLSVGRKRGDLQHLEGDLSDASVLHTEVQAITVALQHLAAPEGEVFREVTGLGVGTFLGIVRRANGAGRDEGWGGVPVEAVGTESSPRPRRTTKRGLEGLRVRKGSAQGRRVEPSGW